MGASYRLQIGIEIVEVTKTSELLEARQDNSRLCRMVGSCSLDDSSFQDQIAMVRYRSMP